MDKSLQDKIKELSKEFSKQTPFRGNIADDRMRPMKESCFDEGAKQMYELLKSRLGNWIDQVCVNMEMEIADGISANAPMPEAWLNKSKDGLPRMGMMLPEGYFKTVHEPIAPVQFHLTSTDYKPADKLLVDEKVKQSLDLIAPINELAAKETEALEKKFAKDLLSDQAPNPERSVATDAKKEKKAPAAKKKK